MQQHLKWAGEGGCSTGPSLLAVAFIQLVCCVLFWQALRAQAPAMMYVWHMAASLLCCTPAPLSSGRLASFWHLGHHAAAALCAAMLHTILV